MVQRWPATSASQDPQVVRASQDFENMGPMLASPARDQYYNGFVVPQSPSPTYGSSSSFHAEAVSQSPSPGSSWSAEHHSVPRMPEGYYDYDYPGYEGQDDHISHMASGTYPSEEYEDDYDSQMGSPTFSDTEWHGHGVPKMPHHSFFDDAYYDPESHPIGYQNLSNNEREHDGDLQILPQSMLNTNRRVYNEPQMPTQSFRNDKWDDFESDEWKDFVDADMGSQKSSDAEHEDDEYSQMSPQSMSDTNFYDHNDPQLSPSVFLDPAWEDSDNPQLSYSPLGNTEWQDHGICPAATQRFFNDESNGDPHMSPQAFSNERHYNNDPLAMPGPLPCNKSRGQGQSDRGSHEQGGDVSDDQGQSHTSASRRFIHRQYWSEREEKLAKVKWARGLTYRQIAEELGTGRSPEAVKFKMTHDPDWKTWSEELDNELLELHQDTPGAWAQISNLLSGPERSEEEVEARVAYLKDVQDGAKKSRQRRIYYDFKEEDDRQIELGVAAGKGLLQMVREISKRIDRHALARRIKTFRFDWTDEDDFLLLSQVGEYDGEVDWDYVGEAYDPPRDGEVVKTRWEYIRNRPLKWVW